AGVPESLRTLVVVPTLLTSPAEIEEQVGRLEVHYLANPEGELRFALLSDWGDAPQETMPNDQELLAQAQAGIARLNDRHGPPPGGGACFLLLHRRRVWNAGEGVWLGWERKRGKLEELNRLLRGESGTSFLDSAEARSLGGLAIRYVLTLDADTRLPREAARRLIGTLAHPLNRPHYDASRGRVTEGYGVLQPRIAPTLPTDQDGSLYQRLFSGPAGIDPYAAAVSDVYQDLFGEGSFTGKGIYDVDAFRAALAGKVPENALLSHDLFEGIFVRAGLVTDIELFEEFPAHFALAASRQHRWARGDWQLLPWILGGGPRRPRIPAIGRFKMLDNLRRTLSAPAAFLTLLAAWTLPGISPAVWTLFILGEMALPSALRSLASLIPRRRGIAKRSHFRAAATDLALAAAQVGLAITFLAHQAWLMSDAIVRTLVRLGLTHKRLLQWVTAAQAKAGLGNELGLFYRRMDGGVTFAGLAACLVALARSPALARPDTAPAVWGWAVPLLLLWFAAPVVARYLSLPPAPREALPLPAADAEALRRIARRTWRFFEVFVGPADRALPPDNFQEDPQPVVAHRTSPTNIGLYLLAVVAARDFGWLGTVDCARRLAQTLATLAGLERFRGHFYNWYDTGTGLPLLPRYISTVDSGNLAGHLLALAQACRELGERPFFDAQTLHGLADAVALVRETAPASAGRRTQTVTRRQLDEALAALDETLKAPPADPGEPGQPTARQAWTERLGELERGFHALVDVARALASEQSLGADAAAWQEVLAWAELGAQGVASHQRDLAALAADRLSPAPDTELCRQLADLAQLAGHLFSQMEFGFLYDAPRKLFAIGYQVTQGELDANHYDLLASEARLASFIAIAKADVPVAHWFQLGRALTPV
ncbi:MAG TPA: glycosyl transferase, partial [Thermoanaerobaculia bacterium]|nr:glycosyl transferase [Thermoanaerobaculia bacterium]